MEAIKISDKVAPIARSPLDAARGRRRHHSSCRTPQEFQEELCDRLIEYLRTQPNKITSQSK